MALLAASASARTLTICAEPDNLPFSRADGTGFEIEIAQLLARDLGADLKFAWVSARNVHGFTRKTLGSGLCDGLIGMPVGAEGVLQTRPYYRTGWMFVTRSGGGVVRSFDDAATQSEIAVPVSGDGYDTAPAAALARRGVIGKIRGFPINGPSAQRPSRMLDAVEANGVAVAIGWGPQAGWYVAQHRSLTLTPTPERDGGLPLTETLAVAVAPGNTALRDALDAALQRNVAAVTAILRKWHVPLLPMEERP